MSNKKPHIIKPNDIQHAEYARTVHWVYVPDGVTIDDVLSPHSFCHVANKLTPDSEIIVKSESNKFYARLLVLSVARTEASVVLLEHHDLSKVERVVPVTDSEYEVGFTNNRYKWGFKKRSGGEWIGKDFSTEQDAVRAMDNHARALAA